MEARVNYAEEEFWNGILEFILLIKKPDGYETLKILPYVYLERMKTLFESVLDSKAYKYERRKELFKKFITRVSRNHRLMKEWDGLEREIWLEFKKRRPPAKQKKKKRN